MATNKTNTKATENANFKATVKFCSKDLTAREKLLITDTSDALKLDLETDNGNVIIKPDYYAVLSVHNEKSDNVDYEVYIIVDKNGRKYVTGSESFYKAFDNIVEVMKESDEEYEVKVYKLDSKNYTGKKFLTCSIV